METVADLLHDRPDLAFDVVDVFVDPGTEGFSGNQLAVVHGADGLDDATLLALAREFDYSETTFPLLPSGAAGSSVGSDYRVRIFTPGGEVPFAGHPTLGTAWVLHARGLVTGPELVQHCAAGEVAVRVGAEVRLTASPGDLVGPLPDDVVERILADVGLAPADRDGAAWLAGTGLDFVHLPVTDEAVTRSRPGRTPMAELCKGWEPDPAPTTTVGGLNLYAGTAAGDSSDVAAGSEVVVHSRVFVPELSVPEDSATGSAATGLGLALVARRVLSGGGRYRISQGREMGRASVLTGRVGEITKDTGQPVQVQVAGRVRAVASGRITVPAGAGTAPG